jgi:hypothetical protein
VVAGCLAGEAGIEHKATPGRWALAAARCALEAAPTQGSKARVNRSPRSAFAAHHHAPIRWRPTAAAEAQCVWKGVGNKVALT